MKSMNQMMWRYRKRYFPLLFLVLIMLGFGIGYVLLSQQNKMPETMPADFAFSIKFGITSKNEINTFNGTFTKDLIAKGTATTHLTFTKEEMESIYAKVREFNILEPKRLIPRVKTGEKTPYSEDYWKIRMNGQMYEFYWTDRYLGMTKDGEELQEVREFIFDIAKNKEEYKKLPEAEGGYE